MKEKNWDTFDTSPLSQRSVNMNSDIIKSKYYEITKHIPSIEDHGHLYIYYGEPHSDGYNIYGDVEDDDNLVESYECADLCESIANTFQYEYEWLDFLEYNGIRLENVFDIDVENEDLDIIASLLLYMVESIILEDKLIDAFNNGFMLRLIKRLDELTRTGVLDNTKTKKYFKWSKNNISAVRLHLELRDSYLDDNEKIMLKRYGESSTGESIYRDILIPSDMPLHNLHYAIQKIFGWQNSHLRRFYLHEDIFNNLTGSTVKGWTDLVGVLFQPPSEGEADIFWDDDYRSGSFNTWLKKKYTGPYEYGGVLEHLDMAKKDIEELLDYYKMMDVSEPFSSYYERQKNDEDTELRIIRKAPLIDLTIKEMNDSIIIENGTENLLERLEVNDVIAAEGESLSSDGLFPLTYELIYNYDFGDDWKIYITKYDHCDELIDDYKLSEYELRDAVKVILEKHKPVCINKDGLSVLDDVGGLSGFSGLLKDIYENNNRKESSDMSAWAKSLGWNPKKISIKNML